MVDYTQIIVAIISLLSALITAFLIPWLRERYSSDKLQRIGQLVKIGVQAAEQLYGSGMGQTKLDYVFSFLEKNGVKFDKDYVYNQVRGMIESAVLEVNSSEGGDYK